MCGIFGYVGQKRNATDAIFEGLKRLDYRGYDSWGIAVINNNNIKLAKHEGLINKKLLNLPYSKIGIGHTRWATHGKVSDINAHPHFSSDKSFVLAQNGIVENFSKIKNNLYKRYYKFISQTDTEVIVRLIEEEYKKLKYKEKNIENAVRNAFLKLSGRNTIVVLTKKGKIVAVRNGSPLVLGYSNDKKEIYVSSDTLSFSPYVDKSVTLENNQMITIFEGDIKIKNINTGKKLTINDQKNELNGYKYIKGKFPHYMLKEIHEQPEVINSVIKQKRTGILKLAKEIKKAKNVYCIGSGTAGAAAAQIAFYLRTYSKINARELIGAESKEYISLMTKDDLIISPSQSGETADVLEILEIIKKKHVKIASYVNMPGSLMTKISDYPFMAQAGPEICVMSTKVFVSQIAFGYLVAKAVQNKYKGGISNLKILSKEMKKILEDQKIKKDIICLSKKLSKKNHIFLLGKGQNLQIIKEGMVKIIEGAYIHAHAIPAGDLKHYAITLMEPGVPVIPVISNDNLKNDVENAINQISARGAEIIKIPKSKNLDETDAILNIVPLQLIAYYMSVELGNNVDKPRNIAKSVTVK